MNARFDVVPYGFKFHFPLKLVCENLGGIFEVITNVSFASTNRKMFSFVITNRKIFLWQVQIAIFFCVKKFLLVIQLNFQKFKFILHQIGLISFQFVETSPFYSLFYFVLCWNYWIFDDVAWIELEFFNGNSRVQSQIITVLALATTLLFCYSMHSIVSRYQQFRAYKRAHGCIQMHVFGMRKTEHFNKPYARNVIIRFSPTQSDAIDSRNSKKNFVMNEHIYRNSFVILSLVITELKMANFMFDLFLMFWHFALQILYFTFSTRSYGFAKKNALTTTFILIIVCFYFFSLECNRFD